jgi:hypothetical protein
MTIDQLFRAFTDADFQYKRFMKIKVFESDTLSRFDTLSEQIRVQVSQMDLSPTITAAMLELGRIEIEFTPEFKFGRKFLNVLCLGLYKKRFIAKKRLAYFYLSIQQRHHLFQIIEAHLKEE